MKNQTFTIQSYRYKDGDQWAEEYRSVPDDMSKEDIVTRALYWLEDKTIKLMKRVIESSSLHRGLSSEI
ncbi:MAG: hypothetical protein KY428_08965, partial [Bacteroidetes bacterium]|nr:hypothetical protein [Bacteroidota bacterium]